MLQIFNVIKQVPDSFSFAPLASEVEIAIEFGYCLGCWIIPKMDFYEWP
jgi:hypothetical protein